MIQLDDLSVTELDQGAADLRNAAYVVDACGHAKSVFVDEHGAVCATGAIDLAVSRRTLVKQTVVVPREDGARDFFSLKLHSNGLSDASYDRHRVATALLADFLPTALCGDCDYERVCDCRFAPAGHLMGDVGAWERIVHYNDEHCTSGELLSNMLCIAAERAEMMAADARKLLTGKVLV